MDVSRAVLSGNQGKPLTSTEGYDYSTDSWSQLPDMPNPHCSCASMAFQDRLYVIGGLAPGGPSNAVDALSYTGQ